jgi:radical SAM superfamily enzyme YgiQ (UPF0313 family)
VNIFPLETLKIASIDSVVRGEGEYVFSDILNSFESNRSLSGVKGLAFKENGNVVDTGVRGFLSNEQLDSIPFPARELVPIQKYHSLLAKTSPITTLMTSRGCPFRCIFCDRPQMGKVFRFRSADNIIKEMISCLDMGIKELFFYDDTFTVSKSRVLDFCNKVIKSGLNKKMTWDIRSRVDTMDEEIIKAIKSAGCDRVHYGVESGTEKILKVLKKDIHLEKAEHIIKLTSKYGIKTLAHFMLGNPTETREDILQTISFAKKIKPDYAQFSITVPYPGTELYREGLQSGILSKDYWKEFAENPQPDFSPSLWEEVLGRDELCELLRKAYKNFYLRPSYISGQLFNIRSMEEFKRKVFAGFKVAKY